LNYIIDVLVGCLFDAWLRHQAVSFIPSDGGGCNIKKLSKTFY